MRMNVWAAAAEGGIKCTIGPMPSYFNTCSVSEQYSTTAITTTTIKVEVKKNKNKHDNNSSNHSNNNRKKTVARIEYNDS